MVQEKAKHENPKTEAFAFHLAPRLRYGAGVATGAGKELRGVGVRRALLVTDHGIVQAGVCEPVLQSLRSEGLKWDLFSDLTTNPTDETVMAAAKAYRDYEADGIIAVGGGSAMDVAKCVAAVVSNGGHVREYEDAYERVVNPHPPLVMVPTTAGTGSEAVSGAAIIDTIRQFKMHVVAVPAHLALCDPTLTLSLPPTVTAATGFDALSHAVGAYVSVEAQPLADAMALYAVEEINRWLPKAMSRGSDLPARSHMMVASLAAGIAMKGGGSAEHALAHAINALHRVHHGVGCAIFLANVMEFNLDARTDRYARIARALDVDGTGMDPKELGMTGIESVRSLVRVAGIPTLSDLGIRREDIPRLVDYVMQDTFHLGLNPVPLTAEDAERLLEKALRG